MGAMAPVILRKRLIAPAVSARNGKILLTLSTRNLKILTTLLFNIGIYKKTAEKVRKNPKKCGKKCTINKSLLTFEIVLVHSVATVSNNIF